MEKRTVIGIRALYLHIDCWRVLHAWTQDFLIGSCSILIFQSGGLPCGSFNLGSMNKHSLSLLLCEYFKIIVDSLRAV